MGMALAAAEVAKMTAAIPRMDYVKEETAPMGQSISRELPRELARGAAGNMSSSALADVFVEMYERYTGGDHAGAREVQFRLLTYPNLQSIYGHALVREVLRRRGVIQSTHPRFGKSAPMDEHDALELDFAWEQLQPYCRL